MRDTVVKINEKKFRSLAGLVLIIFLVLVIRLWVLQIMQGSTIMVKSKENQTRTTRISAPRGLFYDRNGKIMVSSRISHDVSVVPEDINNNPEILSLLSRILKLSEAEIKDKIKPDPKKPTNPYQYIPIYKDINAETTIKLYEAKLDLPGVEVDEVPVRSYLNNDFASHLFGYVREINNQELEEMRKKGHHYRLGDLIGKTGLERTYEEVLRGIDGGKVFEVDIRGRPLRLLENREPVPGNNLHLTIDEKLQLAAEKALDEQLIYLQKHTRYRNAKSGAVIALDPRNGNVLAMVSKPSFDPNLFTGVLTPEVADELYNNPLHPFMNRVIQGEFSPGSTFKPVTVFSALMEGQVDEEQKFHCTGLDPVWKRRFPCWIHGDKGKTHGWQTVVEGLKNSCNIVMAELCRKIGPDILAKYSRYFGFGRPTGINLYPGERLGLVADPDWKMKNTREKQWYPLETLHFGIGQGFLTVTPIQLAQLYAAIANNGKVYRPQLVSKITTPSGETVKKYQPKLVADLKAPRQVYSILQQGLAEVVSGGTASWVFQGFPLDKYPVAGKTGTVQKPPYDNSGVFSCYAPMDRPEIVVIVLIEQGGSGSGGAAPVARKILESYFDLNKEPLEVSDTNKKTPSPSPAPTSTGNSVAQPGIKPETKRDSNPENTPEQKVKNPSTVVPSNPKAENKEVTSKKEDAIKSSDEKPAVETRKPTGQSIETKPAEPKSQVEAVKETPSPELKTLDKPKPESAPIPESTPVPTLSAEPTLTGNPTSTVEI